jgi:hypothetical protein
MATGKSTGFVKIYNTKAIGKMVCAMVMEKDMIKTITSFMKANGHLETPIGLWTDMEKHTTKTVTLAIWANEKTGNITVTENCTTKIKN